MRKEEQCILIGIAGGSGSGKSTFATNLAASFDRINVKLIEMDDYFKEDKPKVEAPFNEEKYEDYDQPDSVDIDRLMIDLTNWIASKRYEVIIIEGLMVLHFDEIREKLHLKLFVDCPSDERLVRRLNRDNDKQTFDEITRKYLDLVRYRHQQFIEPTKWCADFIINGSRPSKHALSAVCKWVLK
ncbi:uridine kinase family protein [Oceanobacillus damuensis]|uniref:uridine kinase family protein n=1 Tax=Oceanobacillus damuensis TaxID=937928 RepID=UPI000830F434|nr:AAA family ATPase [Oceanobacillus damuensis]